MPLGTEVGLGPGHIVLEGNPASPMERAQQPTPSFRPISIVAKRSPISANAELSLDWVHIGRYIEAMVTRNQGWKIGLIL